MLEEKTIVNVQFKSTLSHEKLYEISNKNKSEMASVKGLIIKYYYINPETNVIGGTYLFENIGFARDYLRFFFLKGIGLKYGIIPETLKMEIGNVNLEIKGNNTKYSLKDYNSS
ncbi:YdhR family protein [Aquimarina gracilis]|uniref:YdhR family protein n=1 Tax=Aquimarina gracilis TaxID=874422 RepID=A0ABU5ZWM9_9FLAO|nr:YdhR family protein [Aquimarina gracilis]MEB3346280.1 YdhR family protein [Aquimarina gracilis]